MRNAGTVAVMVLGLLVPLLISQNALASTRRLSLTFQKPTTTGVQIARCAAASSGWVISYADSQGFSSTQQAGEDTASLNVLLKPDGNLLATLSIDLIFGMHGNGSDYLDSFVKAFPSCGATPSADYLDN